MHDVVVEDIVHDGNFRLKQFLEHRVLVDGLEGVRNGKARFSVLPTS